MSDDTGILNGAHVFLVEDEALVAMLVEDMLADYGCTLAAHASRISDAITHANDPALRIDVALLDVNVAGEPVFAVAAALAARGVPFAFATGYGAGGLPDIWRDRPTLQKPFMSDEVGVVLARALAG